MRLIDVISSTSTLITLVILQLIVSLLQYNTQDWIVQWETIIQMSGGVDLYEAEPIAINGVYYNAPNHLPIFFHTILILVRIFGIYPQVARVFLWVCTLILTLIVVRASDVGRKEGIIIANLFLMSPILIGVNFIGVFDQMVMMLLMGGIYLSLKNWRLAFLGGLILGLGAMTKIIVVLALPILILGLLLNRKLDQLVTMLIGFLAIAGATVYSFYSLYGQNFIDQAFLWQTRRIIEINTIWSYLNIETSSSNWFWIQFATMAISFFLLIRPMRSASNATIYFGVSTYIMVFLLVSRVIYSHYVLWVLVSAFPALYVLYRDGKIRLIIIWIIFLHLISVGSGISVIHRDILEPNLQLQLLGAVILNISLYIVFVINIIFLMHLSRKDRAEASNSGG